MEPECSRRTLPEPSKGYESSHSQRYDYFVCLFSGRSTTAVLVPLTFMLHTIFT